MWLVFEIVWEIIVMEQLRLIMQPSKNTKSLDKIKS
jgi:hypothetical protein